MPSYLEMWTIYDHPTDYPDGFIARKWIIQTPPYLTSETVVAPTLEAVRRQLPPGLTRLERSDDDDPAILETWF